MSTYSTTNILAPFEIWEVPIDNSAIKFHQPLILNPKWLDDEPPVKERRYLGIEFLELDISAFGANREELWRCVLGDIQTAWKNIVRVPNDTISIQGKKIKDAYLAIADEVFYG